MSISDVARRSERIFTSNSPLILTGIGVTGVVTTAILTGKAAIKANQVIDAEQYRVDQAAAPHDSYDLTLLDKVELTWKIYLPAVGTGLMTCVAIIGANQIGTRRAAAMAAAYSASQGTIAEYQRKVVEKFGEAKEQQVRDEIAQDRLDRHPEIDLEELYIEGKVLCYDMFSDREFHSSMEDIKWAQNAINNKLNHEMYASLGDFYDLVGLPPTGASEELGWTVDHLLDIEISTGLTAKKRPCLTINFRTEPIRDYFRLGRR